ncbi:SPOR domain-containing protein [Methyloceanibacter sp.]|uniref:SPOR domain-containing protein n=1 Tax=Methyloceanibacter sp. TaxID=1965321 RepID=UPI003C764050
MPSFNPLTRGGQNPAAPAAPQPAPAVFSPQPKAYADPALHHPHPAQPQDPHPAQPQAPQPQAPQPQAYAGGQDLHSQPQGQPQPQAYATPATPQAVAPNRTLPEFGAVDPGFPDSIFGDVKLGAGLEDHTAPLADEPAADASFPDEDASFLEPAAPAAAYQAAPAASQPEAYAPPQPQDFAAQQPEAYAPPQAEAYAGQPMPGADDPAMYAPQPQQQGVPYGHVPPSDPSRQLQTLDPNYAQPPQIALGDPRAGMQPAPQDFLYDGSDADFVDASVAASQGGLKSKVMGTLKGRSTVMVASALLGAIALGGALAYAYKQSGGGIGSGDAPIVTADASPVKAAPDSPGGKEFPNKNKLIYDRLTNGATPQAERLVPRQEDVAVPAMPPATATAGLPGAVATTDAVGEDGGPRKVKTMVVRPDGSMEGAAAMANEAAAGATSQANSMMAQPNMMPVPAIQQAAGGEQVAVAAPAAAAAPTAAASSAYVVQLGSSKSQTDALANFADAQQKYPSLLGNYQPLVRKTDLGPKGTWYRLQVGPMSDKDAAYKLCGQLKSKGHGDCLVMAQ